MGRQVISGVEMVLGEGDGGLVDGLSGEEGEKGGRPGLRR